MSEQNEEYQDDGHTIADMNVEGLPWYRKEMPWYAKGKQSGEFTKEEQRWIILGTVKAALMIAGAFLGGLLLIILILCIAAWIRY